MPIINGNFEGYTYTDGVAPPLDADEQNAIVATLAQAQTKRGTTAPDATTVGAIGQIYADTSGATPVLYICTAANDPTYTWVALADYLAPTAVLNAHPVGDIWISATDINPSTLFGGTWVEFATGRTLIGYDSSNTSFSTLLNTGGALTHTHTVPTHRHSMSHTHTFSASHAHGAGTLGISTTVGTGVESSPGLGTELDVTGSTAAATASGTTGASSASYTGYSGVLTTATASSLPPYIVVRFWQRTA